MIDNVQSMTPSAEQGCRLTALMESGGVAEVDLTDKSQQANFTRRRRLNVRPTESPENVNFVGGDYRYNKKRKPENNSVMRGFITDDQVELGTSSSEVKKVRENLVTCWSHGSISLIGRRREMEDAVSVKPGFLVKGSKKYDYFGVYDGHGGSRVAHLCHDFLHCLVIQQVLEEEEDGDDERINWEKVMCESFSKMDEKVNKEGTEMATMGSTAVVAVVGQEELIVANCGDSRAVLSRAGVALPLSVDHKPDRPDELDRIENSGGRVINWNGQRILGVLATSRSIDHYSIRWKIPPPKNLVSCDMYLKPYVIPDPEVIVSKRSDEDEFLILASDGLWDVIPNDVACHVTRRCLNGEMIRKYDQQSKSHETKEQSSEGVKENLAARAASFLAELAIGRGSTDNISIVVIDLNRCVSSSK